MVATEPAVRQTARDMTPTSWKIDRSLADSTTTSLVAVVTVRHREGPTIIVWCETEQDVAALVDELRGEAFRKDNNQ